MNVTPLEQQEQNIQIPRKQQSNPFKKQIAKSLKIFSKSIEKNQHPIILKPQTTSVHYPNP